jgi:HEAT repeat protein
VREEAKAALRELAATDPSLFFEQLRTGTRELQRRAAEVLRSVPGFEAARLIPALGDDTGRVYPAVASLIASFGESAVPDLVQALASGREELRRGAVLALQQMGSSAWPVLVPRLNDPSHRVRLGAAQALDRSGWTPADDRQEFALRYALEDWDAIAKMRKAAVPPLLAALSDPHFGIREEATRTLGRIGDVAALVPLLTLLVRDPEEEVRAAAAEALGRIGEPRSIPYLRACLRDRSHSVRLAAATALETFGWLPETEDETIALLIATEQWPSLIRMGESAVPWLIRALADDYYGIRIGAGEALLGLGPIGRAGLERAREDANPTIRDTAIGLLAQAGPGIAATAPLPVRDPDTTPVLVDPVFASVSGADPAPSKPPSTPVEMPGEVPFSPHEIVQGEVSVLPPGPPPLLALLATLNETRDGGPIRPHISAPPPMLRERAIRAFIDDSLRTSEEAGHPAPSSALIAHVTDALANEDPEIRLVAVEVFGRLGPDAVEPLMTALQDHDRLVRCAAVDALAGLMDPKATPSLLERLSSDPEEEVREHAAWALGESRDPEVVPALVAALSDPYERVRTGAAASLALFGPAVAPALRPMLTGSDPYSAIGAARTLGMLRDEESIPGLVALLERNEPEAGGAAIAALIAMGPAAERSVASIAWDVTLPTAPRVRAIRVLGGLGTASGGDLATLTLDADPEVAAAAASALETMIVVGSTHGIEPVQEEPSPSIHEIRLPVHEEDEVTLEAWHRESPSPIAPTAVAAVGMTAAITTAAAVGSTEDRTAEPSGDEERDRIGSTEAIDPVTVLCGALWEHPEDAPSLLHRLGRLGDPRALTVLAGYLFAGDPPERRAAAEAMRSMSPDRTVPALAGALLDPDPGLREVVVDSLSALATPDAMSLLVATLGDTDYAVRQAAHDALMASGPTAVPALIDGLGRQEREIRSGAAHVLEVSGWTAPSESDRLTFTLASEDWRSFDRFGEEALDPLAGLLHHPDPDLRLGSLIAIGGIGGERAIDLLRQALADPSPLVRNRAALLLRERRGDELRS